MSELQLDQDEIVYTDPEDGLAFTRADFPSADYPEGARVRPASDHAAVGTGSCGTVVSPGQAQQPGLDVVPEEWVPVLWDATLDGTAVWVRASALKLL